MMKIFSRRSLTWAFDTLMAGVAFALAMLLRYGDELLLQASTPWLLSLALFMATAGLVFMLFNVSRGVWRYASLDDLKRIVQAATMALLVYMPLAFIITRLEGVPRSVPVIAWVLLIFAMGGARLLVRLLREGRGSSLLAKEAGTRLPVLLLGAGDEAEAFIRACSLDADSPYRVLGVVDTKGRRVGRQIRGVDVLGQAEDLPKIVEQLRGAGTSPVRLVLTRPAAHLGLELDWLLDLSSRLGLHLARLPAFAVLADGGSQENTLAANHIREVALEDLLNRAEVVLDRGGMEALVRGQTVLVTGAGGTIGSELCRQIAALSPAKLVLYEQAEFQLYKIDLELTDAYPQLCLRSILGDVCDSLQLQHVFAEEKPQIIFHAAAYKHVPLGEANVRATLATNILGTLAVAEAAAQAKARAMVQISTDKAVNPTNVMGASKRVAEMIAQSRDTPAGHPRFITVRFGNVMGSTGSVVPRFQEQLQKGGPITVTHPEIKRYFMSVREAVELVLQASSFALTESKAAAQSAGQILVLDMGAPVKIADLARQLIRLAGLKPDADIAITYTGLRPGEKLKEELFRSAETLMPASASGIQIACAAPIVWQEIEPDLLALLDLVQQDAPPDMLRAALQKLVPEYAWR